MSGENGHELQALVAKKRFYTLISLLYAECQSSLPIPTDANRTQRFMMLDNLIFLTSSLQIADDTFLLHHENVLESHGISGLAKVTSKCLSSSGTTFWISTKAI